MAEKSQKKKNCAFHRWGCLVQLWSCQLPHYAYFFPYSTVATWINPIKMAENRGGLYFIPTSPRYWNEEGARLSRCSPCSLQNPTSRRLVWARGTGLPSQGGDMSVNAQQPPGREAQQQDSDSPFVFGAVLVTQAARIPGERRVGELAGSVKVLQFS